MVDSVDFFATLKKEYIDMEIYGIIKQIRHDRFEDIIYIIM